MGLAMQITMESHWSGQFVVGRGSVQVIEAICHGAPPKVPALRLVLEDADSSSNIGAIAADTRIEVFPQDEGISRLFITIAWRKEFAERLVRISLSMAGVNGMTHIHDFGTQALVAEPEGSSVAIRQPKPDMPLVCICMATYEPNQATFMRQIETLTMQTHRNWVLVIADDASSCLAVEMMRSVCELIGHDRLILRTHDDNVGFYSNFERALSYVPLEADFVALADQDDFWYPDKLEKLLAEMTDETVQLAYSDMRIVQEDGAVLAETYWQGRKNEYQDFTTVFLANTVTGAASLFRRKLLTSLLPFPHKVGDAFHDHWLALVAMTQGKLAYVDEPLYDYYQYGSSVIGHCDFTRWSTRDRLKSVVRNALRLLRPRKAKQWLGTKIGSGLAIYRGENLRLRIFSETLRLRQAGKNTYAPWLETLNLIGNGWRSFIKLMQVHFKILSSGKTTDDAEFRLALAELSREYERRKMRA